MIIKSRHHWFYYPFFSWYSRRMPRRAFSRVEIHHDITDRGLPVLVVGNHISWWDGFLAAYINFELFHRRIHIMMLEEQLEKRMFLNRAGAYSIRKGSRSAIESLQYTAEILSDPANLAVLYPQGKIHSVTDFPVSFEKGWHRVFSYLNVPIQMVCYVALFDYFSNRKPELHLYLYDYAYHGKAPDEMETDFNGMIRKSIDQQKQWA